VHLKSIRNGRGSLSPRGLEEREKQQRALMQPEPPIYNFLQPAAAEAHHEGYQGKPVYEVITAPHRTYALAII